MNYKRLRGKTRRIKDNEDTWYNYGVSVNGREVKSFDGGTEQDAQWYAEELAEKNPDDFIEVYKNLMSDDGLLDTEYVWKSHWYNYPVFLDGSEYMPFDGDESRDDAIEYAKQLAKSTTGKVEVRSILMSDYGMQGGDGVIWTSEKSF